jgi:hypothetical protein
LAKFEEKEGNAVGKDAAGKHAGSSVRQLLLCQVGVGRSFCVENEAVKHRLAHNDSIEIPEGYDSLYLHNGKLDPDVLRRIESEDPDSKLWAWRWIRKADKRPVQRA